MQREIGWNDRMKQNNLILIRVAKENNWNDHFSRIFLILAKANVHYLNPEDFFQMFMPLHYQSFDHLHMDDLPGMQFPFDDIQEELLFFKTLRYWLTFHFTEQHLIPPVIFGSFWYGLAYRYAHSNELFDKSFRILSKEIIRVTCLTNSSNKDKNHHLYESGYEYVAVTGVLSGLLRGYVENEDLSKSWVHDLDFLEFFNEMSQKIPFKWANFFQTKENAERFCFLLHHLLRYVIESQETSKKYFDKQVEQGVPVCLTHVETLLTKPTLNLFLILTKIWTQICLPQIIDTNFKELPTTRTFFETVLNKSFKPTACSFTMKIANDPYTKNENRIIFLAQFDGFHPSFWLPTSKKNLRSMTVHGLQIDKHVVQFLEKEHLLVPLKEFSPCKLQKEKRLLLILQTLAKEKVFLSPQTTLSKIPWFSHEKIIFPKLERLTPCSFQCLEAKPKPEYSLVSAPVPSLLDNLDWNTVSIDDIDLFNTKIQ